MSVFIVFATPGAKASPANISGLVFWLDGGDIDGAGNGPTGDPPNGAFAALWGDLAAGNDATQAVAANQPSVLANALNGRTALRFDGNDALTMPGIDTRTVFAVTRIDPATDDLDGFIGETCCDLGIRRANDVAWNHPGNGNDFSNPAGSTFRINGANTTAIAEGVWHILEVVRGSGTRTFESLGHYLGGRYYHGDIAEVIIYDRELSATEIDELGSYLSNKYGLGTAYPSSVPPRIDQPEGAGQITGDSATLNGSLISTGSSPTSVTVYWGSTDGGTNPNLWSNAVPLGVQGLGDVAVPVSGLSSNTSYYYRFKASNATHEAWADSTKSFHTDLSARDFTRRLRVDLCGYSRSTVLTNFPVAIQLSPAIAGFNYADFMSATGGDLRVADANGTTALDVEIESWTPGGTSIIWVRIPRLEHNQQWIWLYWGDPKTTPPAGSSDGSVWHDAYRGVWHMTEPLVEDSSFPRNDGDLTVGSITTVGGVVGSAQSFNDSYIRIENEQNFDMREQLTVSTWIRVDGGWRSSWQALVSKRGEGGQGWQLRRRQNQNIGTFTVRGTTGTDDPNGLTDLNDGQWHHMVGTYDGVSKKLFIDGQLDLVLPDTGLISLTTVNNEVNIGAADGGLRRHRGRIDEVRILDRAMSEDWVRASYENTRPGTSFICFSVVENGPAPWIENAGVSAIVPDGATLHGDLISLGGSLPDVRLFYGLSDGGTVTSAWDNVISLGSPGVGPLS
ncbi:MAG: DUF2341 domain-containing protein, partial [Verrucomicrobiota bacterium]